MKKALLLALFGLLFLSLPAATRAYELKTAPVVTITEDQVIEGNLYAAGNTLTVNGTVNGDVFLAGQNIIVNGKVTGDVFAAGENITVNNEVGGSVRAAGANITINKNVGHGVQAFGSTVTLSPDAAVGGDFLFAGAVGNIQGKISGDLHGGGATVIISGEVDKDVKLRLDERVGEEVRGWGQKMEASQPLVITDTAKVGGNVYYTAGAKGEIASGAVIGGEVGYSQTSKETKSRSAWSWGWHWIYSIFASLVIGLVLISLWRVPVVKLTDTMLNRTSASFGWGIVMMFVTPFIILLLLLTIIGIPLAVILAFIWLAAMYIARTIVGILIGRAILSRLGKDRNESIIWAMISGVVIIQMVSFLPFIGWLFSLAAIWWALGGIWLVFLKKDDGKKTIASTV